MFCPRCGTRNEPGSAFCEHCGEPLAPAEAPPTAIAPAPPGRGRSRRGPLIAGAVVAALAATALVLVLTGALAGDDPAPRAVAQTAAVAPPPSTVTAPAIVEPATPTDTTPAPAPTPAPAAPRPVHATVARTCGRDGVGGDCHLSVRARPAAGAAELRRLDEGDALRLRCQVRGDSVHSSALGASTTVWSKTTRGGYVSNAYVTGPRLKAQAITLPRC